MTNLTKKDLSFIEQIDKRLKELETLQVKRIDTIEDYLEDLAENHNTKQKLVYFNSYQPIVEPKEVIKLKCIIGDAYNELKRGNTYKGTDIRNEYVTVINDKGQPKRYQLERFEITEADFNQQKEVEQERWRENIQVDVYEYLSKRQNGKFYLSIDTNTPEGLTEEQAVQLQEEIKQYLSKK